MTNYLFDTHCHFDTIKDAQEQLPRAYEAGVRALNVIGCDLQTSTLAIDIVKMVEEQRADLGLNDLDIMATVGLHPHEAKFYDEQNEALVKLIEDNKDVICGIGEAGYDFYYGHSTEEQQTIAFDFQLDLAKQYDLALVIHTRDAWEQTFELLNKAGWPRRTVFHCFTGGPIEAKICVENGGILSISGISTFKNAGDIREAIASVPSEFLMGETDSPWLAPVPYRGKLNEPAYVENVVAQICKTRFESHNEDEETVKRYLFENSERTFR